jgi:sugar-phosphatase
LFDLDGTLVDTEPRSQAAWARLFRAHGVEDNGVLTSFAGRPGLEVLKEHLTLFPGHDAEELFAEAVRYLAEQPAAPPVRGAADLVRRLASARIPMAVVTSATQDYARRELTRLGVLDEFAALVTTDDVHRGKPDPEGYLAGCAALGVAPEHAVVFEDAPAGVAAAKAAGTFCVAVTTTLPAAALAAADLVLPDLHPVDIQSVIEAMLDTETRGVVP